jgi:hypothetical protein
VIVSLAVKGAEKNYISHGIAVAFVTSTTIIDNTRSVKY